MFTFIINPASRSGLGRQVWERLEPVLDRRGISYKAYMTCCQRHATRLARELEILSILVCGDEEDR